MHRSRACIPSHSTRCRVLQRSSHAREGAVSACRGQRNTSKLRTSSNCALPFSHNAVTATTLFPACSRRLPTPLCLHEPGCDDRASINWRNVVVVLRRSAGVSPGEVRGPQQLPLCCAARASSRFVAHPPDAGDVIVVRTRAHTGSSPRPTYYLSVSLAADGEAERLLDAVHFSVDALFPQEGSLKVWGGGSRQRGAVRQRGDKRVGTRADGSTVDVSSCAASSASGLDCEAELAAQAAGEMTDIAPIVTAR